MELLAALPFFALLLAFAQARTHELRTETTRAVSRERNPAALPYKSRDYLVTQAEKRFFHALKEALGEKHFHICPKVRWADLVNCDDETWHQGFGDAISRQHIDFVLADSKTLRVRMLVELDDSSHDGPHRQARDRFLEAVTKRAGLPLLRVKTQATYDVAKLRARVFARLRERTPRIG